MHKEAQVKWIYHSCQRQGQRNDVKQSPSISLCSVTMFAIDVKVSFESCGCGLMAASLNNSILLKVFGSRGVKDGDRPGMGEK